MNITTPIASAIESNRSTVQPYSSELDDNAGRWFLGCRVWLRAEAAQTGGGLGLIEQLVPPGMGSPYHVHHREDEAFYVLEGAIRFFSEGRSWVLGAGGFAFLPRGIPHGFRTEGDAPSRSLLIASPGGFEGFMAELSSVEAPVGPPDMDALMAAAGHYGLEILGPLPA